MHMKRHTMKGFKFSLKLFGFILIIHYTLFTSGKTILADDQDSSRLPVGKFEILPCDMTLLSIINCCLSVSHLLLVLTCNIR